MRVINKQTYRLLKRPHFPLARRPLFPLILVSVLQHLCLAPRDVHLLFMLGTQPLVNC